MSSLVEPSKPNDDDEDMAAIDEAVSAEPEVESVVPTNDEADPSPAASSSTFASIQCTLSTPPLEAATKAS